MNRRGEAMSHERFRNSLSDYLEETLSAAEHRELETHLGTCPECSLLATRLRETLGRLHAFPRLEVPADFTARVLERTIRRPLRPWEIVWSWVGLPRLSPAAAAALLALPLIFLAGTRDGRQLTRETSMAVHRTYSDAVRLYHRRGDLRETAVAAGKRIPGQLEGTVDWIRQRIGTMENPKTPPAKPGEPDQQSLQSRERGATA